MESQRRRLQIRKRQRRIRSTVRAAFCIIMLTITVAILNAFTGVVVKLSAKNQDFSQNAYDFFSGLLNAKTEPPSQQGAPENKGLMVCIDAGHGGKDAGSNRGSRLEKDDTLKLALAISAYLQEQNIQVTLTRSDDTFLELSERCDVANNAGADYFVSVHRNTGNAAGVETWIYSEANKETIDLAEAIMRSLDGAGIQRNRGVKKGTQKSASRDYYLNSHSNMPTCIVEMGFIDNDQDNQLFDANQAAYAKAIGDAVIETYNAQHPGSPASGSSGNTGSDGQAGSDGQPAPAGSDGQTGSAADTEGSGTGIPSTEENTSSEPGSAAQGGSGNSHTLNNTPIENLAALDNTTQDWGQGVNMDDQNRPVSALSFQEKYAQYNANFIVPDTGGQKLVYLTLDEGYEYGCTSDILDTLKEKQVPAVFFLTGSYAKGQTELVRRMVDEGHALGNHSATHPANGLPSQSIEQQQAEISEVHNYIRDTFGYEMHLFRYPAGKFSDQSLAVINNCNYKSLFWSFAYRDYDVENQPDKGEALEKLVSRLHSGAIYLLHAESTTNTEILGEFIDRARAEGYEFALFD